MRKIFFIFLIFILLSGLGFGQEKKLQVSIFGGINNVFEYGSEDDYIVGENDFPITPAHTPAHFGAAFTYFFKGKVGIELEGRYALSSKVVLEDPSDQDTVEINTSKHYSVTLNLIYQFLRGSFRPYLVVGGGVDKLLAKDESYTSQYGYEIEFLKPDKTIDPLAHLGAGIHYLVSRDFGAKVDVRYVVVFNDINNVNSLSLVLGVFLRL